MHNFKTPLQGTIARCTRLSPQRYFNETAYPDGNGGLNCCRVIKQSYGGISSTVFNECLQHSCRVRIPACSRVVLGIGNDDWTLGGFC
ncbi:hypothetical protein D3C80_1495380 [compost metagenome]